MYDIKTVNKTLSLLKQYNFQFTKVSRKTGIKLRTIVDWHNKSKTGGVFKKDRNRKSKRSINEQKLVIDYYFEHEECYLKASKNYSYALIKSI